MRKRFFIILGVLVAVVALLAFGAAAGGGVIYALSHARSGSVLYDLLHSRTNPVLAERSLTERSLEERSTDEDSGLVISVVEHDGPAAAAGVTRGDVPIAIDDQTTDSYTDLVTVLKAHEPGDEVTLTILHGDDEQTPTVTLGDQDGQAYLGITICGAMTRTPEVGRSTTPEQTAPETSPDASPDTSTGASAGALIVTVASDSPAEKAGMKQGDIILKFGGKETNDTNQLRQMVAVTSPGTKVKVEVFREGERETLEVTVGELESGLATIKGHEAEDEDLGMTLKNLTPEIAEQLGLKQTKGVVVTAVEPFSVAAKAGLRPGDVIVAVQNKPVNTLAEFNKAMSKQVLKKGARLTVLSEGMRRFVLLKSGGSDE
jgi:S1-C subfamily serine protease